MSSDALKTRILASLQDRLKSLFLPLHHEQAALRREMSRRLDDSHARIDRVENTVNDLAASVLFSRWMEKPDTIFMRNEVGHWLNWLGLGGNGVEVGVFQGEFSNTLLRTWSCNQLTSVDPWREFPAADYVDTCNLPQAAHDANHALTMTRLAQFAQRSRILRQTSAEAAADFDDASLDFVYLDAQHHYEAVRDDIGFWYPKVRKGGVIGGHDYLDGERPSGMYGVKRAVDEFAAARGLAVIVTREPDWPSWFARIV